MAAFGVERSFTFQKSRATVVDDFNQPIGNVALNLQDRAHPQLKLLPVDVLILSFVQALPGNPAGLIVSTNQSGPLQLGGRIAQGLRLEFLQLNDLGGGPWSLGPVAKCGAAPF